MNTINNKSVFKYNMSFYYQSTIIYFIVFILYVVIRGEFVEHSFTLITKDPIIYFFAIIVGFTLLALLFNLYKNRHLELSDEGIGFVNRFRQKKFALEKIEYIRISRNKRFGKGALKFVRIKIINRRRPLIIRPYDYENHDQLVKKLLELKERAAKK